MINYKFHEKWMYYALKEAEKAENKNEVPIGAVVIFENNIIGRGFNQVESLKDSTAHAEMIAITSASNFLDNWRLNECSLYVTKQPCLMCIGSVLNSRIQKLYYGMHDLESNYNIQDSNFINKKHLQYIEGGILADKCKNILQKFFIKKR